MSDSKFPRVTRTLLSILVVLNNVVVWMVSTRPFISKSSSLFNNLLVTAPKAPITIGIIVTFMFHNFFNSQSRSNYYSFHILSVLFCGVSRGAKSIIFATSLFHVYIYIFFFFKKKNKTGHIRIINLFPSCYMFLIKSKNTKKIKQDFFGSYG